MPLGATGEGVDRCVYVVIVNWNGWSDTIECLESLARSQGVAFRIVVVDNDSSDDSVDRIAAWAAGHLVAGRPTDPRLRALVSPPLSKPLPVTLLNRASAEAGGTPMDEPLVLVRAGANLGFAGGCNVGIRYAQSRPDFRHVWLLNPDTLVSPSALRHLVERAERQPSVGQVGSRLMFYHQPDAMQAAGGMQFRRALATSHALPPGLSAVEVERRMDYVVGASLLATREFVEVVGLMSEAYFLYFEEIDWAERGRPRFALGYAPESLVYHKEGGSIGSSADGRGRSALSDRYLLRNRLRFAWRHRRHALPLVWLGLLVALGNRVRRGQWGRAFEILRLVLAPVSYRGIGR